MRFPMSLRCYCLHSVSWLGFYSTYDVQLPGVGFVFLGAQLPPPPPSVLTDWEISMRDWIPGYQHKTYV